MYAYVVGITALSIFVHGGEGLMCHKCGDTEPSCGTGPHPLGAPVPCPKSTMCLKKTITHYFPTTSITVTVRSCAPQTQDGEQKLLHYYENGVRTSRWERVTSIYEVYEEGCSVETANERATTTELCFCRGDLCNAASALASASNCRAALLQSFIIVAIMHSILFSI